MPRSLMFLLVLALIAVGLLFFLSSSVEEVPQTVIEENVALNAAG